MTSIVNQKNIGSLLSVRNALAVTPLTAGGSADNTQVFGPWIDRMALDMPLSAVFAALFTTTLAASKTLTLTPIIQHSPDNGTTVATYVAGTATVVATATGAQSGQLSVPVDLNAANRYVRFGVTPHLSNTATDTANVNAVAIFAGMNPLPAL